MTHASTWLEECGCLITFATEWNLSSLKLMNKIHSWKIMPRRLSSVMVSHSREQDQLLKRLHPLFESGSQIYKDHLIGQTGAWGRWSSGKYGGASPLEALKTSNTILKPILKQMESSKVGWWVFLSQLKAEWQRFGLIWNNNLRITTVLLYGCKSMNEYGFTLAQF